MANPSKRVSRTSTLIVELTNGEILRLAPFSAREAYALRDAVLEDSSSGVVHPVSGERVRRDAIAKMQVETTLTAYRRLSRRTE